jgi:hypothetical protein
MYFASFLNRAQVINLCTIAGRRGVNVMILELSLNTVRLLTISEIVERWVDEGAERALLERELRLAVLNLPRLRRGEGLISPIPPEEAWPPSTTLLSKADIEDICAKQKWPLPRFWFDKQSSQPSFPGRPSLMAAIVQELERRASANSLEPSLAREAEVLFQWAREHFPGEQTPKPRSIENGIREEYRRFRNLA